MSAEGLEPVEPEQAAVLADSVEAGMAEYESREVGLSEDEDEADAMVVEIVRTQRPVDSIIRSGSCRVYE